MTRLDQLTAALCGPTNHLCQKRTLFRMFEIALIALICLFSISILWYTLKTGIPPMPSSGRVCRVILEASEKAAEGPIIDLGSGWGGLLFALARKYPDRPVIGYELSWLPWIYSQAYSVIFRLKNVRIYRQNFLTTQLPDATLLICYLHPKGMQALQKKLSSDGQKLNTLLISNTFALPENQPVETLRIDDLYRTPIYIYRLSNP